MTNTYKCPKCAGTGFLSQYVGIANGVCFSCEGNGFKVGVAPVAAQSFAITAIRAADAARVLVCHINAKSAAAAVKRAATQFAAARVPTYIPESAEVAA